MSQPPQNIGDKTLKDTYSLAFSKINNAIVSHYRRITGGDVALIIKYNKVAVLSDGKVFETLTLSALDNLFNQVDIQELRKNLKRM